ncbi:MAG TPA: helix-turn-helix transcriptional regulator [Rhizobium sp.]
MGTVQKLTIEGKGYVLLSEEDYEDLIDEGDARDISARIAAGEETWPSEVVKAIVVDHENKIRVFRKYRGLTIEELAEKASLSRPYVSELETGKKEGSVSAIKAIAAALNVGVENLI